MISSLTAKIECITEQLNVKDAKIDKLEKRIMILETDSDNQEQYSRRPNVRINGLTEQGDGTTDDKVLSVINTTMGLTPPLILDDIERSHRIGPKTDNEGRQRTRVIIVLFRSERTRDRVFRGRTQLKTHNQQHREAQIFIHEDLTARRASLAFQTRVLKRHEK